MSMKKDVVPSSLTTPVAHMAEENVAWKHYQHSLAILPSGVLIIWPVANF
jgi:hypothetical protein